MLLRRRLSKEKEANLRKILKNSVNQDKECKERFEIITMRIQPNTLVYGSLVIVRIDTSTSRKKATYLMCLSGLVGKIWIRFSHRWTHLCLLSLRLLMNISVTRASPTLKLLAASIMPPLTPGLTSVMLSRLFHSSPIVLVQHISRLSSISYALSKAPSTVVYVFDELKSLVNSSKPLRMQITPMMSQLATLPPGIP